MWHVRPVSRLNIVGSDTAACAVQYDPMQYDILTCAQKLAEASLVHHTEAKK